jgi:hypothetical protein
MVKAAIDWAKAAVAEAKVSAIAFLAYQPDLALKAHPRKFLQASQGKQIYASQRPSSANIDMAQSR